jgi:predicted RNA-binding Zn-ribbon protein involved in translation (DUF1610 family)
VPIVVTCPTCHRQFKAPDTAAGKKAKCPQCGGVIQIPAAAPEEEIVDAEAEPRSPFDDEDLEVSPPVTVTTEGDRRPCPMCGELIQKDAVKCRFCGEIFDPLLRKQAERTKKSGSADEDLSVVEWIVAILCGFIGCIVAFVYMAQGKPKGKKMLLIAVCANIFWIIINALLTAVVEQ